MPPLTTNDPVLMLELLVVLLAVIVPDAYIFPTTSSASVGILVGEPIATLVSLNILNAVVAVPLLFTLKSMLPSLVVFLISAVLPETDSDRVEFSPIETPLLVDTFYS